MQSFDYWFGVREEGSAKFTARPGSKVRVFKRSDQTVKRDQVENSMEKMKYEIKQLDSFMDHKSV